MTNLDLVALCRLAAEDILGVVGILAAADIPAWAADTLGVVGILGVVDKSAVEHAVVDSVPDTDQPADYSCFCNCHADSNCLADIHGFRGTCRRQQRNLPVPAPDNTEAQQVLAQDYCRKLAFVDKPLSARVQELALHRQPARPRKE